MLENHNTYSTTTLHLDSAWVIYDQSFPFLHVLPNSTSSIVFFLFLFPFLFLFLYLCMTPPSSLGVFAFAVNT